MFDFVDLFAGVGGFHAALSSLGGRGVQAAEIEPNAARVYEQNWGLRPDHDVRYLAEDPVGRVKDHAVLTGGFPCQPFSKSGRQRGMREDRGTLFHDILAILEAKTPPVVMLENVRNLAGPRQTDAWRTVIMGLRAAGYKVSSEPCVFSPHLLSPEAGGAPQKRERLYILGVYVGPDRAKSEIEVKPAVSNSPQGDWDPKLWSIRDHVLLPEPAGTSQRRYQVKDDELIWIETWNDLLSRLARVPKLPGFPMWEQYWNSQGFDTSLLPTWKQRFVRQNVDFYNTYTSEIDAWRNANPQIERFPASRRKLEWQAQDSERNLWSQLLQFRPSGIRAKQPTYAPTLVAMNQTSIYGPLRRRLTPLEAARLQGFDAQFTFGLQTEALGYKQMGNAVNVGAAAYVLRKFVIQNAEAITELSPGGEALVDAIRSAADQTEVRASEQIA